MKAEKEVLFFAVALSLIFIFTSSANVSASLGITPAKYQVNFEPVLSQVHKVTNSLAG